MFKKTLLVMALGVMSTGATCWKPVARTVLDMTEIACLLEMTSDRTELEIKTICKIADDLMPEVRKILEAKKMAEKKRAGVK